MSHTLLRLPAVLAKVGLGRSAVYQRINRGEFPSPIKLGVRAIAWPSVEIDDWIAKQIAGAPRKTGPAALVDRT